MNIKTLFEKEVVAHPIVVSALGAVALIAIGSGVYYAVSTRSPASHWAAAKEGSITQTVVGSGSVEPAQNPDLAFVGGGRVVSVRAAVGQTVYAGQVLASLDTAALVAQERQDQANVQAAQARLDEMQAGPLQTDVNSGKTAVAQAQQSLANTYANISATLTDAYNKAYNGVRQNTDSLFSSPTSNQPVVSFQTTDSQSATDVGSQRASLNTQFAPWLSKLNQLSASADQSDTEESITYSIGQLTAVRTYSSTLLQALANAVPSSNFSASSIAAAQTAVSSLNTTVSSLILSLQGAQQQIASSKLAVQSAQDALAKIMAGATPQDIEAQKAAVAAAQAGVESVQAQIANDVVVAPFTGTVASVNVKAGQTVAPNTVAVSLTPHSALQVELYVSEVDSAKLAVGDAAHITLDAYGSGRIFDATVASIDRSPAIQNGVTAYKVVLQFASNDPAISIGMGANATIVTAQKQHVLTIAQSAVIQNGSDTFVLVPGARGPVQQRIQTGINDGTNVEVVSGLSAGDQYLTSTN